MRIDELSDDELVSMILEGGPDRKKALARIYNNSVLKTRILNFLRHRGADEKEAKDLHVESIVVADRNIRAGKFNGDSSLSTYVFAISKFTWLNYKRSMKKEISTTDYNDEAKQFSDLQNPELSFINDELKLQLERIMELLSEKCKIILQMWSGNASYNEIAAKLGVENNGSLRKKKLKCIEKLEVHLRANPELIPSYYNG